VLADEATPLALPAAGIPGGGDLINALAAAARHGFPGVRARSAAHLRADAAAGGGAARRAELPSPAARAPRSRGSRPRARRRPRRRRGAEPELAKARADLKSLGARYNGLIAAVGAAGAEPPDGRAKKTARGGRARGGGGGGRGGRCGDRCGAGGGGGGGGRVARRGGLAGCLTPVGCVVLITRQ
jgi:hypothetical protein